MPQGKKAISCKWVYKVKLKADGSLERLKARLVVRGFTQRHGIDFDEVFSPVVRMTTIRSLIAVAAHKGWHISQFDVNNAFLHGDLHEEVYMMVPQGIPNPDNKVYKLRKSLYGLKQASRQWFQKLSATLLDLGYQQSKCDYSLFINKSSSNITIIAVYVDDILITGSDTSEVNFVKSQLDALFGIKDLGSLHYFLGLELAYLKDGIFLSQKKFTYELLQLSGISDQSIVATPLPLNCKVLVDEGIPISDPSIYRTLIGKLNFLIHTRPDLSFTVQTLSQFMQCPRDTHFHALQHTLKYVKNTVGQVSCSKAQISYMYKLTQTLIGPLALPSEGQY